LQRFIEYINKISYKEQFLKIYTMTSVERKITSILGLINMRMLVNSDYLLERERERERDAGVYKYTKHLIINARARLRSKENKSKLSEHISLIFDAVFFQNGRQGTVSPFLNSIQLLREDYIRTDPPFL
jgi:hypothetical protein